MPGNTFSSRERDDSLVPVDELVPRRQHDAAVDERGGVAQEQDPGTADPEVVRHQHNEDAHHVHRDGQGHGQQEAVAQGLHGALGGEQFLRGPAGKAAVREERGDQDVHVGPHQERRDEPGQDRRPRSGRTGSGACCSDGSPLMAGPPPGPAVLLLRRRACIRVVLQDVVRLDVHGGFRARFRVGAAVLLAPAAGCPRRGSAPRSGCGGRGRCGTPPCPESPTAVPPSGGRVSDAFSTRR